MIHSNITLSWVYEHYLTYLYLSIADCDCLISGKELSSIKEKAFKALDPSRCDLLIKEVYYEYRSHTETEKRNYIAENAVKYLRTDAIRQRVISELELLVNKDQESEEYVMFRFIRKVINNCTCR